MSDPSILLRKISEITAPRYRKLSPSKDEPDLSLFDFVGLGEVLLSNVFRWLLDRKGSHNQDTIFLEKFLDIARAKSDGKVDVGQSQLRDVKVQVEDQTEDNRRIDIVLNFEDFLVGIENKVSAADQPKQVDHYIESLKKRGYKKSVHLIYLSPHGFAPNKGSLSEEKCTTLISDGILQLWSYREDIDLWLANCLKSECPENLKTFINKLRTKIIDDIFGGIDMSEVKEICNLINQETQYLESAMVIMKNQVEIRKWLWNGFTERLYNKIRSSENFDVWNPVKSSNNQYPEIKLTNKSITAACGFDVGFVFFFLTKNFAFSGLNYGIWLDKSDQNGNQRLSEQLTSELLKVKSQKREVKQFGKECRILTQFRPREQNGFFGHNWADFVEPWIEMAETESMMTKILDLANSASSELHVILKSV